MNPVQSLLNLFKKKETPSIEDAPDGYCPNCWGYQEYGGQFFEAVINDKVDVNSASPNVGWVQDYANKHLSKIKLQPHEEGYVCPNCKVTYREK